MTEKLQSIVKEEVAKLPPEAQEAIRSSGWEKITEEIGGKYMLLENEINDVQTEILLVLIGLEYEEAFVVNIENEIGLTAEEAEKISAEVLEKIFIPVSDKIAENIKKSGKVENSPFHQTLDFILSGGNYSAFLQEKKTGEASAENRTFPTLGKN
jgi:hypothetical protein